MKLLLVNNVAKTRNCFKKCNHFFLNTLLFMWLFNTGINKE